MIKARELVLFVVSFLLLCSMASAESFIMQGAYVKAGVSSNGTLGYGSIAPPGIQHDPSGNGNFGIDDYLTPGSPWEIFSVKTDQTGIQENSNNNPFTGPISTSTFVNLAGKTYDNHVVWTGKYGTYYEMRQEYFFNNREERINMVTTITALRDLTGVKFLRAIDPDPDVFTYNIFETSNGRGFDKNKDGDFNDPGDIKPEDWVHSIGARTGLTLGIYSNASYRHNTGVSRFWTNTPDFYLAGIDDGYGDFAIGQAFDFDSLKAGQSVTFNYAYVMGDVIGSADIPWVPSVVYEQPPAPSYSTIPADVKTAKRLIVITHGWNSSTAAFADEMKASITAKINAAQAAGTLDPTVKWTVMAYDWSQVAGGIPFDAWTQAKSQGKQLGALLKGVNYDYIHFIAHSAGSQLIQSAIETIAKNNSAPPAMQSTFLDAYHPVPVSSATYGAKADWSEQYLDTRPLLWSWADTTDTFYPLMHNFDVTSLDMDGTADSYQQRHAWPYQYYLQSVKEDYLFDAGLKLSVEDGKYATVKEWRDASRSLYPANKSTIPEISSGTCTDWESVVFKTTSSTGTVYFPTSGTLGLKTGSPVWFSAQFNFAEPVNVLSFDYQFLSSARGVLSVYLDSQLIFKGDEQFTDKEINSEIGIPLGELSGTHTLSFRLDPFSEAQSNVEISNVRFGYSSFKVGPAPEDVDDDGDGYTENQGDCNDHDATIYPGAREICDGIDNNCNSQVDEAGFIFGGVASPVSKSGDSLFKAGQTIPVKVSLTSCTGAQVPTAQVAMSLKKLSSTLAGTFEEAILEASGSANTGSLFRYDVASGQFIFNLSTKGFTTGTYQATVQPDNGESYPLLFSIKQ